MAIRRLPIIVDQRNFVARFFVGLGVPFGNSSVLPYVKQYFGGGTNGIRAWRVRELGPGGFLSQDTIRLDQTGDLRLEFNAELRFPLFSYLEGALFVDMGNIWLIREDETRPETLFKPSTFMDQIAVGVGFGLRLNFNYFIIRFDTAMRVRTPYPNEDWGGSHWFNNFNFDENYRIPLNFNLGIGYPF